MNFALLIYYNHFETLSSLSGMSLVKKNDLLFISAESKAPSTQYLIAKDTVTEENFVHLATPFFTSQIPFIFFGGQFSKELENMLISHGLENVGPLTGIYYDLKMAPKPPPPISNLHLSMVHNDASFQKWAYVLSTVWNRPIEGTHSFFKGLLHQKNDSLFGFIATINDQPVGCSILDIQGDIGGCYWDCVLPDFRKQGIGSAMIIKRLQFAKKRGVKIVVAQCLNSSLSVYQNLGFQPCSNMAVFRYAKQA